MTNNLPTILLIEDQSFSVNLFKAAFQEYTILTSATGKEGIDIYKQKRPEIIFLDIGLPDISGFEVLKGLIQENKDAFIIMLSAMNNKEYVKKAVELGAKGFLTKPYNKEFIQHYISAFSLKNSG